MGRNDLVLVLIIIILVILGAMFVLNNRNITPLDTIEENSIPEESQTSEISPVITDSLINPQT